MPGMARRRRVHKTSPKTPSRVKKRTRKRSRTRSHHHPELVGLALVGAGVFLAAILWFGLSGGPIGDLVRSAVGGAAYLAPLVLVPVGALVVTRSRLVDVGPFQLGLAVALIGLELTLGTGHGGAVGDALASLVALGLGSTGATILGVLLTVAGVLLLTGASLGAIVRRTGHAVRVAHTRVRAVRPALAAREPAPEREPFRAPPVDVKHDYPDLVSETVSGPSPLLLRPEPDDEPTPRRTPRRRSSTRPSGSGPTTSCRSARCCTSRSPARDRTARRPRVSPTRSSRVSPTSASRPR